MRVLLIAILLGTTVISAYADVKDIRVWQSPDSTRLVFDLSEPTEYRIFDLPNPYRIVIDLNDADMNKDPDQVDIHSTAVKSIRKGKRNGKDLRIVIDVNEALEPSSQILPPNDTYPNHRLVVDLKPKETAGLRDLKRIGMNRNKEVGVGFARFFSTFSQSNIIITGTNHKGLKTCFVV